MRSVRLLILASLTSCSIMTAPYGDPEVHGHRGCRGLLPENTIPAFIKATEMGCDWLEMDVVLNADSEVVVSHEPWMDRRICLDPDGDSIPPGADRRLNIYHMTTAEMQRYDCGSREQADFPEQEKKKAHKPLLREVIEAVDEHILMNGLNEVGYNIEIKSDPQWVGIYQPAPEELARRVIHTIHGTGITKRTIIQSFDPAVLEAVHASDPRIPIALLVEHVDLDKDLALLSFRPDYYSPSFDGVDATLVDRLREKDIGLLVWTVDRKEDMQRMI
ncbi:MAG: glycerophosphodiester phosphodiesterase, partial [Flavobacteriales bacterium]|nr:glycerophosphodiester phosphodiesterase [Flavobacteriales bacterium]